MFYGNHNLVHLETLYVFLFLTYQQLLTIEKCIVHKSPMFTV